ncbi:diguanylate cyclase [Aliikangiella marina]|uniref:Diguanylate cyclase n=1 Tax=Aliikangiella marina TaxID=1712262 RepID=A0A545TCX3_9GAMM|nr:GGDEF domain-containing protein [Aliikangiella marina]TQV75074.1 diguanylate cyclase [Aliikangiella marina]
MKILNLAGLNLAGLKCLFSILILTATQPILGAQLVNNIPVELSHGWTVCLHFESSSRDCVQQKLPELTQKLPPSITHQSYVKEFIISSELKSQPLGIWIKNIDDADKVLINEQQIGNMGQFPPNFESAYRRQRVYFIPNEILKYNQFNRIEIITHSSRQRPGIQTAAPMIGNFVAFNENIQEQDYVFVVISAILIMLMVFPIFYFIVLKGNYETLYFMFFLLSLASLSIARSNLPVHLDLDLSSLFKLEIFMLNAAIISLSLYLFHFFELEIRRIYAIGLYVMGVSGLVMIIWPDATQMRQLAEINYWLLIIINFFVAGSALFIAAHKQRRYAWLMMTTSAFGWLTLCYDSLMYSAGSFELNLVQRPAIVPIVSALVSITFTLILTHKYWHYFKGSTYDHLTGTLLRPAFFQRLSEEMQRCNRGDGMLLVAVIDIQQAKRISINYGYSIGNHLLSTVSNSLTKVLRPYDLICRFSDEQFCVASSITKEEFAEGNLQRIYDELINIQQPINKDIELYVDARIGGVIYNPELHMSVSHIIQDANYALAKASSSSQQYHLLRQSSLLASTA